MEIGRIEGIFRYPVKSMRGEALESAAMGWHGLEGDRLLAFRRLDDRSGFPWLSASRLPELLLFTPQREATHVRTPEGDELPAFGDALAADVGRRCGLPLQMMTLRQGIFDDAAISVITSDTIREIARLSGTAFDVRRFRPNILVRSASGVPFEENQWDGRVLSFGDAAVTVTARDLRCSMVNFDPDTAESSPHVLKAVAQANEANAGSYATVTRAGRIAVGQAVELR